MSSSFRARARRSAPSTAPSPACPRTIWARSRSRRRWNARNVDGKDVSETILGQILTAAQGQNPARQASVNAGIPYETPAWIVNQLCGSGLRAVALGYQAILNGDATHRRRGRPGEHEPGAACRLSARRPEDGRARIHRHHDQGRADGRLPRLSHGRHGGERGARMADHPRDAGPFRRRLAEQGGSRAQVRPLQGRDRRRSRSRSARARRSSTPTNTSATA